MDNQAPQIGPAHPGLGHLCWQCLRSDDVVTLTTDGARTVCADQDNCNAVHEALFHG